MKVIQYNKLVRDKIVSIIEADGRSATYRQLRSDEQLVELHKKLQEEVNEYLVSNEISEIADIYEVLEAILKIKQVNYIEINKIKEIKANTNGKFEKGIFLINITDK